MRPKLHRGPVRPGESGFTVLEALLALAILAILAAVAIPAVTASSASVQLTRAAAEYAGAFKEARANAITQSTPWAVTIPAPGQATYTVQYLDAQGQWQTDHTASLTGTVVSATAPAGVTRIVFAPSGGPNPACSITLSAGTAATRLITIQPATGRVVVSP